MVNRWPRAALAAAAVLAITACQGPQQGPVPGTAICGDGRLAVDPGQVAIDYSRLGFTLTAGYKGLAVTAGITPQQVQKAEESTQNWDRFIQGAALAHNACSGTKDRLSRLIERYAELKAAREAIEAMVKTVTDRDVLSQAFQRYFSLLGETGEMMRRVDLRGRALRYMAEGRYSLAIRDYEELLADEPRSAPLWRDLGAARFNAMLTAEGAERAHHRERAIASFQRCVEVDPGFVRCRYNTAQVLIEGAAGDGPDVAQAGTILDSLEGAAVEPEVRAYVVYYQGYVALLRNELREARARMLATVNERAAADAFLRTFSRYNLAIADSLLSAGAGVAPGEAASLREEAVASLLAAVRLAGDAPGGVGRRLKGHFRRYGGRYFAAIATDARWPEVVSAIDSLAA